MRRNRLLGHRTRRQVILVGLAFSSGALIDFALSARLRHTAAPASQAPAMLEQPQGVGTSGAGADDEAALELDDRLLMPVDVDPRSLRDTYEDARGEGRSHEAIDIMAPRGTAVRAVQDGTIVKMFRSRAGGITIYQFDPTGTFCFYYAHLDRYASGLAEGQVVERGQVIGFVGSTGNASADAPHLHFALFRLGPERRWWSGEPINPYPLFDRRLRDGLGVE